MQAKKSILSMAAAGLLAVTGAVMAYGPGPGPQGGGMGYGGPPQTAAEHVERLQSRLDALKEALKLQPNQVAAWDAYEARVKSEAQAHFALRQTMQQQADSQALADQRVAMMKQRAQAAEDVNGLRKALVATLTPEQKATFDQYSAGPGFAGGAGYGPGGGRGPGAGRGRGGCLGAV
jgi:hypothetical protein